jgi:hypothetical protein
MLTGHCHCGDVRFEIHGKVGPLVYCHCETCRRINGTAFSASVDVRTKYLKWIAGREGVREYESSPGKVRAFCPRCGSPIYSRRTNDAQTYRIRLGVVEGDPGRRALAHFFVSEKAPWYEICDELPQYPGNVPQSSES